MKSPLLLVAESALRANKLILAFMYVWVSMGTVVQIWDPPTREYDCPPVIAFLAFSWASIAFGHLSVWYTKRCVRAVRWMEVSDD